VAGAADVARGTGFAELGHRNAISMPHTPEGFPGTIRHNDTAGADIVLDPTEYPRP
jgi:hypothetical protein